MIVIVNIKMKKKQRILITHVVLIIYDDAVAAVLPARFPAVVFVVAAGVVAAVVVKAKR
jgi:hypothetical protein